MTDRKPVILFDIDGTVANLSHRLHFIQNGMNDWDSFNAGIPGDKPIMEAVWLQNQLRVHSGFPIIFASGRSENERKDTQKQLQHFGCYYEKLYMRPAGDKRADYIIKREILDQIREDGYEPYIVIDDRQSVVDMWRDNGLFVLQCDPGKAECRSDVYKFHEDIKHPLIIMVGPSGAGKSTLIDRVGMPNDSIISSDSLRLQLTGDFRDQSRNAVIYPMMLELASQRLKMGLPVILDATHCRRKDRINAVKIIPNDIPVMYMVVNRSLEDKIKTKDWRDEAVIRRHDEVFKSNLKDILKGDDMANVEVTDCRK